MKAAREVELKLEVSVEGLRQLERSRLLRGKHLSRDRAKLVSVYFDTRKFKLRKKGISLRVRHMNGQHLQGIKCDESGNGTTLSRNEWETEVNGKDLDLEATRGTALEPLLSRKIRRDLRPIFETRVRRTAYPIRYEDSDIELSFDEGRVEAGRRSSRLYEVELELKHGQLPALFRLAHQLAKHVPAALSFKSKADRGYQLLTGDASRPVKAFRVKLTPTRVRGLPSRRSRAHACISCVRTQDRYGEEMRRAFIRLEFQSAVCVSPSPYFPRCCVTNKRTASSAS